MLEINGIYDKAKFSTSRDQTLHKMFIIQVPLNVKNIPFQVRQGKVYSKNYVLALYAKIAPPANVSQWIFPVERQKCECGRDDDVAQKFWEVVDFLMSFERKF